MKIRFSALLEEVYGVNVVAYHRTKSEDIISGILEKGFVPGYGMMYGQGFYATYDLDSQLKPNMKKNYGDIILKVFIKAYKFLIFDYDVAKKIYKKNYTLLDQLKQMNLLKYVKDLDNVKKYSKKLKTIEYSSDIALQVYEKESSIISSINGIIFTGKTDGKVIVAYEPNAIVPMAFSEDDGKSWNKINNKQALQRYFINKQDVLTKQNKISYSYNELTNLVNSNKISLDNAMNYLINTKNGEYILYAGRYWKEFDFKKGLDALIDLKDGNNIYNAGRYWKEFDFKKGLDALIDLNALIDLEDGKNIYKAGIYWKEFDYNKALDALFDLKESYYIYKAGSDWKKFDYKKGLDALIYLKDNKNIFNAGKDWKEFDYNKGLDVLINLKDYNNIYNAGLFWKKIDYNKGLDALIELRNSNYIYDAGKNWKEFDYKKGLDGLINIQNPYYIFYAGQDWKEFDYKKGLNALKQIDDEYYEKALKSWKGKY
jgi:hypothetical protein